MDPRYCAQDILLCDLCQTNALQSHCEFCGDNLCVLCVGKHLSLPFSKHSVVPYSYIASSLDLDYENCLIHTQKHCELYCEKCDTPICSTCISSGKHKEHDISDEVQNRSSKSNGLEKELKELKYKINPVYEDIESDLKSEKINLEKHYEKLTTAVTKRGEEWHREIDIIVKNNKSEIHEMKTKHLAVLNKEENDIQQITSDIKQSILDLKTIMDSSDVSLTPAYKSRNAKFRHLPPKVKVSLPSFSPHQINKEKLNQMFGTLSALSIITEERGYTMRTSEAVSCPPVKPVVDKPELIATINTEDNDLMNITMLNDEEIWTSGTEKIIKLYNLQGKLLKSIHTKSGSIPSDIAVTRSGDLVYTDPRTRTVNMVKNKQIQEVIRLQGWKPNNVCNTSSGDLLVIMVSDDEQSKVVRYSGSSEKQTIQFYSKGALYSYNYDDLKYICENRNLDICVADSGAHAIIVVNQAGEFRFRYTGHPTSTWITFNPAGITTDSQGQILTVDCYNKCIHILDQDGQFLRFIDNCDLKLPHGLCVDTRDNLFVAELEVGKMKKIKYM
ncbi:E3 ubiquitin-protein ligase TRIM36-like [Saccostrea cucullata]|uniref:E3 ubiquitin-protein ligase TRIM36-like n=1 Tax=Saccostrea cuccullata TaxID=36930 RepID=UPI002ED028F3